MYIPNYFKSENLTEVKNFLNENSFGILISQNDGKIAGTHIPMELDKNEKGENILVGHISKANPQSKNINNKDEVLAILMGHIATYRLPGINKKMYLPGIMWQFTFMERLK